MPSSPAKPLTASDSAWLRMEDPTNLMTVTGVMLLQDQLDLGAVKTLLEEHFLVHDRFRQRVVENTGRLGKPYWEDVPDFRLDDHLHTTRLDEPRDERALQDFVGTVMSTPLDYERPLWHVFYIENLAEGAALVVRMHHCMADGMALVRVLLGLTSATPDGAPGDDSLVAAHAPHKSPFGGLGVLRAIGSGAASLGKLAFMRSDPKTVFKGPLGARKRVTWSRRIPVDDVKAIGRALGGTVNDVLLTAVAAALRSYMSRHHDVKEKLSIRAVVPVNLRSPHEPQTLGNKFGMVFLSLPVGIANRREQLRELRRRMDRIKRSAEPVVVYGLLRILGATAAAVEMMVVNLLGKNATAVMTNVPGPSEPLYLCGSRIDDLIFWVPQSGKLSIGVSILSYVGQVRLAIAVDAAIIPEPEAIVSGFHNAIEELKADAASG